MRVLVAFDKFKDALSAEAACAAAAPAIAAKHPDWSIDLCPLTDGGEGFAVTLTRALGGSLETLEVAGPRRGPATAAFGLVSPTALPDDARAMLKLEPGRHNCIAIADLASTSGLALLPLSDRNPWETTTLGAGQLLAELSRRVDGIVLGIGGSATNDLGCGALSALGVRFLDAFGTPLDPPTPKTWVDLARLEGRPTVAPLAIACDVVNPLLGPSGATAIFGPQKGLPASDVRRLDALAGRVADSMCGHFGQAVARAGEKGMGAAGGFSFGLAISAGAKLLPGFDFVAACLGLNRRLAAADLVVTGEGRFDATSLAGKAPGTLSARARRLGKTAHIFAGSLGVSADRVHHPITPEGMPLAAALPRTAELLQAAIAREL
ncbi:MAG TPA: glycerate kinase [Candidatus Didemnitutus sp.]|nr:glycerate kinase [Candidatus Didemnitutus sp.]